MDRNELKGLLDNAGKRMEDRAIGRLQEELDKVAERDTPDRSKLPKVPPGRQPYGSAGRTGNYFYDRLPKEQRELRSPEVDAYIQRWAVAFGRGNQVELDRLRREEEPKFARASLLEGAAGAGSGAHFLPEVVSRLISLERDKVAKIRKRATVVPCPNQTVLVPHSTVATAAMAAEGAVAAEGNPTLTTITLRKKKAQANFLASWEMVEDCPFSLASFLSARAGSALGALEDAQFATGTGVAPQCSGIDAATITAAQTDNVYTIIYADLVALYFALPDQYRVNATFFGSNTTLSYVNAIISTTGASVLSGLMNPPRLMAEDDLGTLFSKPVLELPVDNGVLYFGDLREYVIADEGLIDARRTDAANWDTDQIDFRFTERIDGQVGTTAAFRKLTGITGGAASS